MGKRSEWTPEDDTQMAIRIWKDTHHISLGKCKLKLDTTIHLLEWPKSEIMTTPNVGKAVEQQQPSVTAGGDAKWYGHFGRQSGNFL